MTISLDTATLSQQALGPLSALIQDLFQICVIQCGLALKDFQRHCASETLLTHIRADALKSLKLHSPETHVQGCIIQGSIIGGVLRWQNPLFDNFSAGMGRVRDT